MLRKLLLLIIANTVLMLPGFSQDAETKSVEVHRWADQVASEIQIRGADSQEAASRIDRSLIRWSNPIVGDVYGDCYLWTQRERPIAFLSVYAFYTPESKRRLTFQSLSEGTLVAERESIRIWEPQSPGIRWLDLQDLPSPGRTSLLRQRQLRAAATSFVGKISESDDSPAFRELRLLPQPLHKYSCPNANISDGAVFAFVDGTDPELLLLVECLSGARPAIRVAPVRQNHRQLQLVRRDEIVWEAEQIAPPFPNPKISDPKGVYFNTPWGRISGEK